MFGKHRCWYTGSRTHSDKEEKAKNELICYLRSHFHVGYPCRTQISPCTPPSLEGVKGASMREVASQGGISSELAERWRPNRAPRLGKRLLAWCAMSRATDNRHGQQLNIPIMVMCYLVASLLDCRNQRLSRTMQGWRL